MKRSDVRGFTLVEVMVAFSIMSLVMLGLYVTLETTLRTRDSLEIDARAARLGPTILDLIEQDLRRVRALDVDGDHVFLGESHSMLGGSADSLQFLTNVDSTVSRRVGDNEVVSDVCETGYRLRPSPELPDVLELWRRQSFGVDEEPLEGGIYERLHDRVVSFKLRYYEDDLRETEPLEEWDASKLHRLPAMVSIELGLEAIPRTAAGDESELRDRTRWYRRIIPLPADTDLAMRVHRLVPKFAVAASADGNGGGPGGGGPGGLGGPGGGPDGGPGGGPDGASGPGGKGKPGGKGPGGGPGSFGGPGGPGKDPSAGSGSDDLGTGDGSTANLDDLLDELLKGGGG